MITWKARIREICTYHGDDGTSGYLLSEKQFEELFELIVELLAEYTVE